MHQAACLICHGFGNSRVGVPQIADCNSSHKIRIGVTLFIEQRAPLAPGQDYWEPLIRGSHDLVCFFQPLIRGSHDLVCFFH